MVNTLKISRTSYFTSISRKYIQNALAFNLLLFRVSDFVRSKDISWFYRQSIFQTYLAGKCKIHISDSGMHRFGFCGNQDLIIDNIYV